MAALPAWTYVVAGSVVRYGVVVERKLYRFSWNPYSGVFSKPQCRGTMACCGSIAAGPNCSLDGSSCRIPWPAFFGSGEPRYSGFRSIHGRAAHDHGATDDIRPCVSRISETALHTDKCGGRFLLQTSPVGTHGWAWF